MLHPFVSLLIHRPELVADHVAAYADLVQEEATSASTELLQRGMAWALATVGLAVALALAGGAVMLGVLHGQFHWILVLVPALALALAAAAYGAARKPLPPGRFHEIRTQWQQDLQLLRSAQEGRDGR